MERKKKPKEGDKTDETLSQCYSSSSRSKPRISMHHHNSHRLTAVSSQWEKELTEGTNGRRCEQNENTVDTTQTAHPIQSSELCGVKWPLKPFHEGL